MFKISHLTLSSLFVAISVQSAAAGTVFYDFEAPCVSLFLDGCAAAGLAVGDPVTGVMSFDEALVIPGGGTGLFDAATPGIDFFFKFGNVTITKSNLQPSPPAVNQVFFSSPGAEQFLGISIALIDVSFLGPGFRGFFFVQGTTVFLSNFASPEGTGNSKADGFWIRRRVDHFLFYDAKRTKGTPKFEKRTVTLTDQFDDGGPARVFKVKKVERLGNPVDKNGEGINDPDTHYVSYKIKRGKGEPKHVKLTGIRVINQFGEIILDTDKPDRLLVPSAKDLENPVEPLEPGAYHFKCYKVKVTKGTPKFEKREVLVVDQFNQPALLKVKKPERLCNPVDKDGEGIGNADSHLLCYKVKRAKGESKFEKIKGIHVNNQFGPLQLDAKKEKELCLPSEKDISGATPLDDDDDDD